MSTRLRSEVIFGRFLSARISMKKCCPTTSGQPGFGSCPRRRAFPTPSLKSISRKRRCHHTFVNKIHHTVSGQVPCTFCFVDIHPKKGLNEDMVSLTCFAPGIWNLGSILCVLEGSKQAEHELPGCVAANFRPQPSYRKRNPGEYNFPT